MKPIAPAIVLASLLAGCAPSDDGDSTSADGAPKVEHIAKTYKHLIAMTEKPVYVDPSLAMLCRGANQQDVEAARKKSGPHAHTAVSIFMNDRAANAFRTSAAAYPVGSIIVKEKKPQSYRSGENDRQWVQPHDGVGGMIKRDKGFDPDHGDWEYFYFEDVTKIESGKIASCVQCHAGAAGKDHVFGGWAQEKS